MDPAVARQIASSNHLCQRNRFGDAVIAHVERVASSVPPDVRATAWLHDLIEQTDASGAELMARGLTDVEMVALELLMHIPGEPYEQHILRIATAPGRPGRIARIIKLAELDDHLSHERMPLGAPSYSWARRRILRAQERRGERVAARGSSAGTLRDGSARLHPAPVPSD